MPDLVQFLRDLWGGLTDRVSNEPVLLYQFAQALIVCAVAFGLGWSGDQVAAVVVVVGTGLSVIARQKVTPD